MVPSLLDSLSCPVRFIETVIHLRAMFARSTFLNNLLDHALECTDAISALPMACQCIMTREGISAQARIRLGARVDLGMSFQIVTSYKAFVTVVTSKLSITKVSLDVGFDVFFSSEFLVATYILANPFVVKRIRAFDELGNVI